MTNITEVIREQIRSIVRKSLEKAIKGGQLPETELPEVLVETPKEKDHGEFSTNIAMQVTKLMKKPPRQLAETIIENMELDGTYIDRTECAGPGFINFYLKDKWLYDALSIISDEKKDYGRIDLGKGKKVMVEFVSANPTGPLHMGNARGGALGDCISSVLETAGYDVTREFYVNDAGNQIEKFGISLEARYIQLIKGNDAVEFPEDGYQGEDIIDHMKEYIAENGDKLIDMDSELRRKTLVEYALPKNLDRIKKGLESYGINYDVWFSEQSLYNSGELQDTLNYLREKGLTVMNEGAEWFRATAFGVDKDEVLVRANGLATYFASDIAYHRNKFLKRNFDWVINLLGADHHGHVARMKAAVQAIGVEPEKIDIVIFQLVRLYRNGEVARMSKRTGKAISLYDLLEEVGKDAARFIFNTKASGSHIDFDLDLAVQQSNDNPVYYVQYAHARICSMLKVLEGEGATVPLPGDADMSLLSKPEEKALIKRLAEYPDEIRLAAQSLEPSRLTRYVTDIATLFHSFYHECRVKGEEEKLMKARLLLVDCTRIVIRNVLKLLSISAPEKM
ncbi:MAG: arginine--tRNA ligase [Clostridiales bacterium]|nr:arginine--tRNA ligase [Clostridiales bacterium]